MGRRIPSTAISSSINPSFSISLLAASVAVMVAIIGALCAAKSRKPSSPTASRSSSTRKTREPSNRGPESESITVDQQNTTAAVGSSNSISSPEDSNSKALQEQQLQPTRSPSSNNLSMSSSVKAKRRLSSSLSMKIPAGNALAKFRSRKEDTEQQKKDKSVKESSKPEDSIWMKTIILGEKCKVPNEDDDAIIYDQNGNRIAAYPARTPRSLPVSRTHSLIEQDYTL